MNKTEKNIEVSKMYSGMSEREVLGCILLDDSKINEIIKYIPTKQVFYHKDHQNIWSAIYSLYKQNKKIDLSVVANYLGEKGFKITYYLSGITEQIVSKGNLDTHAKIIYDLYRLKDKT